MEYALYKCTQSSSGKVCSLRFATPQHIKYTASKESCPKETALVARGELIILDESDAHINSSAELHLLSQTPLFLQVVTTLCGNLKCFRVRQSASGFNVFILQ